jgi:carboxylesterase
MTTPLLLKNAEPFYFPGSQVGCLLVHGFTGTPVEMRGLGEFLAAQGHTVLGIRLAGHGTRLEDMARMQWVDWLAGVEDGYRLLKSHTRQIFAIGLSMGGILSLTFAARFPLDGVVAMATPHHLPPDPRLPFLPVIALFQPYRKKGPPEWFDMQAYEQHVSYPADPTKGYLQLKSLLEEMRAGLPAIECPVKLIYSRNDPSVTAAEGHMEAIYAALGSAQKEQMWVENSGHILTSDQERQRVWQAVDQFIKKVAKAGE